MGVDVTDHPIPAEAFDGDIAVLGRKGSGKSYTAKGIVERLLDMGRRVLILDPLGVWAGLRTAADGEGPGYPIAIFGGEHADLPLDPAAAEPLARIIATENLPAVIDLSELSKTAQQAFLLKFLHELRRVNREALTIVLEEADVFSPQNPQGEDSKMLHSEIDWIARRGRFRGFRLITITQRPARLSKDVLTQANALILHRLPAPQDRDAAKAWVDGNGDRDKSKEVFDTLANLDVGEAWILAQEPAMLERASFPRIKTLDTSSTPKAGEKRIEPKTLAEVDVSAIRAALEASVAEKAKPTKAAKNIPENITAQIEAAEQRGYQRGHAEGLREGRNIGSRQASHTQMLRVVDGLVGAAMLNGDSDALEAALRSMKEIAFEDSGKPSEARQRVEYPSLAGSNPAAAAKRPAATKPETRVDLSTDPLLNAALQVWPAKMTWAGLAAMCGRKARGGHFNTTRKRLIETGVVREEGDLVIPTNPPASPAGVVPADLLEQNLPQPAQKMFVEIRQRPGVTVIGLASVLQMQPRGGHWNTGMSILRRNGLIVERGDGLFIADGLEG